mgnify:CR=1 FL=1
MNKKDTIKNIIYKAMNKISFYLYLIKVYVKQEIGMFDHPGRNGYIVLDHCYYTQKVFNVAYVKNVMHLILYYLDKGYTPIITEINKNSNLGGVHSLTNHFVIVLSLRKHQKISTQKDISRLIKEKSNAIMIFFINVFNKYFGKNLLLNFCN